MWSPTHIQVTVQRAKNLLTKGKNGTNNCFVTIGLGKEKYQTSVKEKADPNVNWNEECELKIPDQGNRAELVLTCLHRNNLGIDEFLGQVTLPLNEMDVYDRPRSKWFKLESKPGKEKKNKERGELEVRVSFTVKSGSLTDLSKKDKHKSSIGQLASSVGGSLLSIGTIEKRKGIKKFAKSLGSKMHLNGKKKQKEGDDSSISGSFASIGTPNSSNNGSRRYGQRNGEADPGVISEDEDEFVFDNLSHKSSGSSLNIRSSLQPPTQNYVPHTPSPLLGNHGKSLGKKQKPRPDLDEDLIDPELEEIENSFSLRARTLPPPSKPARTPQLSAENGVASKEQKLDEWESKLYGSNKQLTVGSSDSLKRRSWESARVPLPTASEESSTVELPNQSPPVKDASINETNSHLESDASSSSTDTDADNEVDLLPASPPPPIPVSAPIEVVVPKPQESKLDSPKNVAPQRPTSLNLISPETEKNGFNQFNASFAKYEQQNSAKIFDLDADKKWNSSAFIKQEAQQRPVMPQAQPRKRDKAAELKLAEEEAQKQRIEAEAKLKFQEEQRLRAEEDERLEAELRVNEERLRREEAALKEELAQQEEQKRREAKRREEDQRLLNFVKRSISHEEDEQQLSSTPEQSPKERVLEQREKRMGKFKYLNKRDKNGIEGESSPSPKSTERIIIGHEKSSTHAERRAEISAALAKKYEGKSREELMLIANGMENEALLQRQRVKELEDYLDNLLLRVMETHPKILQNPYARTTSAKSG